MAKAIQSPPVPQGINKQFLWLLIAIGAVLLGGVYGYVLTGELPLALLLGIPLAGLAIVLGARQPELLTVALLGVTWGYVSEVLVKFQGAPSIAKSLVVVLVAIAFARRFTGKRTPFATHPLLWWMIGYFLVVCLGLWYAKDTEATWLVVIDFAKELMLFFVVINMLTTERWLERGVWAMLIVGGVIATITVYQEITHTYDNIYGGFARSPIKEIAEGIDNRARAGGTTSSPNAFGQQMIVLVPIGLWAMLHARTLFSRIAGGYMGIACLAAAALSFSRGTYLAAIVMFVLLVIHLRLNPRYLLVIPVLLFALTQTPPEFRARFDTLASLLPNGARAVGESDASLDRRYIEMTMAAYMFADHPIAGVGADNYRSLFPEYVRSYGSDVDDTERNAHSYYLEVAAENGLIGLSVIVGIIALTYGALRQARNIFRVLKNDRMAELAAALMISFGGYLVTAIFLHGDYSRFLFLQVGIAAAFAIIAQRTYAAAYPPAPAQAVSDVPPVAPQPI